MAVGTPGVGPVGGRRAITVLVADDEPLMRSALRMCLCTEPDIEVMGEARDGLEAVAMAERLRPDVVIMDIRMPNLDGVAATQWLTTTGAASQCRVLIITTFDLDEYIVEGLRAGASGFLLKDATPDELVHTVRVVAAGEALLSPRVTRRLLDLAAHRLPPVSRAASVLAEITPREVAVLNLVAAGRSNAEIGRSLHLAESSVKSHVGHLLGKLGLADRVHLVIFAYDNGLAWKESALASDREDTVPIDHGRRRRVAFRVPEGGITRDTNQAGTAAIPGRWTD
jgi:DNA-binding NarL/FixJ family response regulator